ncbi:Gfo/Idh/MocA family oxidoreductase [Candidatus Woesearchaeota archaeon]|nr:Gfo/Idh/MocA family oxidoreductase [Candidatus Woesearchaeota archaeon]
MMIGIIGLGSIGQRHAKALLRKGVDVHALRTLKGAKALPEELSGIIQHFEEKEFYDLPLDGIIIANPTSLHAKTLRKAAAISKPIFIEKPLASSMAEIEDIKTTAQVMVGYNLRHHPLIVSVKRHLPDIGTIYKANLYCGQYLPSWHPYTDYRKEYYAQKKLRGGALRTMSHDIDLAIHLFGKPNEIIATVDKISDLEIDVDDHAQILLKTGNTIINIEDNYLDPTGERKGTIIGREGMITYSFATGKAHLISLDKKKETIHEPDGTDSYEEQMRAFREIVKGKEASYCTIEEGKETLKIIEAAERQQAWKNIEG